MADIHACPTTNRKPANQRTERIQANERGKHEVYLVITMITKQSRQYRQNLSVDDGEKESKT